MRPTRAAPTPPSRREDTGVADRAALVRALATLCPRSAAREELQPFVDLLRARGAHTARHSRRSFLDHLLGTWRVLAMWDQSPAVCRAGLFHSVYGTQYFQQRHVELGERDVIRALLGDEAEELAFLFCAMDRRELTRVAREFRPLPDEGLFVRMHATPHGRRVPARRVAQLLTLEAANIAEQSCASSGAPSPWLATVLPLLRLARTRLRLPPLFDDIDPRSTEVDEADALQTYERALTSDDDGEAARAAARAAEGNPWVAEPRLALACSALARGDVPVALGAANDTVARLVAWGTAWDKRQPWSSWLAATLLVRADASERGGAVEQAALDRRCAEELGVIASGGAARPW